MTITYSRPGVKKRTILGGLVPYGEVWRTGANENTTIAFSGDVLVEGQKLAAGTYGLHTIPTQEQWTIIFSKNATAWGSFSYKEEEDALRVEVQPHLSAEHHEWLLFSFPVLTPGENMVVKSAQVSLQWEKLEVPFTVMVL